MPLIIRSPEAHEDMDAISDHIASHNVAAGHRWLDEIEKKLHLLASYPELGQSEPELGTGLRIFSLGNYAIIYRPVTDGIEVVRVIDARRDYVTLFRKGS